MKLITLNLRTFRCNTGNTLAAAVIALALTLVVAGCNKGEDMPSGAAPTISLSPVSASGIAGAEVSTRAILNAPAGLTSISVLKNGAQDDSYPEKTLSGTTGEYDLKYIIEEAYPPGTIINFTFILTDELGRSVTSDPFRVTVTNEPPKAVVQVGGTQMLPGFDEHIPGVAVSGLDGTYLQGDVVLTKDKNYVLISFVRVGPIPASGQTPQNDDGRTEGTLTIEPGTVIFGDKPTKGTLVIQRGGKIFAEGTEEAPIVFTSSQAPGERTPGDWGGLVICGRATNNEGMNVQLEGGYGAWHGGNNDDDNSGIITYCRIEWAGIPINPNEEVNTVTMGSVGRNTKMQYIQASFGLDDQFEWFGGTVDGRYLIAYRGLDDDFDVDLGHSGNIQFGIGIRDSKDADQSGSNGFEVDNNGSGELRVPYTSTVFSNMTIIGPKKLRETSISAEFQHGAQLRRSSQLKIYNSIITGYPMGIYIDGNSTIEFAQNGELQLRNLLLAGVRGWGGNGFGKAYDSNRVYDHQSSINAASYPDPVAEGLPFLDNSGNARGNHPGSEPRGHAIRYNVESFDAIAWFNTPGFGNRFFGAWDEIGIDGTVFDRGTPNFRVTTGSPAATSARWDNLPALNSNPASSWFSAHQQVPFVGAFGTDNDWTEKWSNFSINTDYGFTR